MGSPVRRIAAVLAASVLAAAGAVEDGVATAPPDADAAMPFSSWIAPDPSEASAVEVAPDGTVWTVGTHLVRVDPAESRILSSVPVSAWGFGHATGLSFDAAGSAYVCGAMDPAAQQDAPTLALGPGGSSDACVAKLAADGGTLLWSLRIGGSGPDYAAGIAVDSEGGAWVSGTTHSTDFPLVGALRTQPGGDADAFVVRVSGDGSVVALSTYLGGTGSELVEGAAVTPDGGVLLWGTTDQTDFLPSGAVHGDPGFGHDGFVLKLDGQGSTVLWTSFPGGNFASSVSDVAVTPDGQIVAVGDVLNYLYGGPWNPGEFEGGGRDVFVARLQEDGSEASEPRLFGGGGAESAAGAAVGPDGTAWVTGLTHSVDLPTISAVRPRHGSSIDAFVAAFSSEGDRPVLSTYLPGSHHEAASDLAVGPDGTAWIVGSTPSPDFPVIDPLLPAPVSNWCVFLTRLRAADPSLRPAPPSSLVAETTGPRSIDLRWEPAGEGATGLSVFRSRGSIFRIEQSAYQRVAVLPPDAVGWTDATIEPGGLYRYCLQAFDETGPSAATEDALALTPATLEPWVRSRRKGGWFRFAGVRGVLAIRVAPTVHLPDGLPDPREGGLEIAIGVETYGPFAHRYSIPPGDTGWRVRGNRFVWTHRTESMRLLRVDYDRRSGRLLLRDYSTTGTSALSGDVLVRVTIGDESGVAYWPMPYRIR